MLLYTILSHSNAHIMDGPIHFKLDKSIWVYLPTSTLILIYISRT